jgi:predicted Zn-dependent protease
MLKKLTFAFVVLSCMGFSTYAQQACGTDDVNNRLKKLHPEIADLEIKLEQEIARKVLSTDLRKFAKTTGVDDTIVYDVPVVIHIVHDYGAEFVTDDAIFTAVSEWTDVFLKQNADTADVIPPFKPWIGDPKIRLHLATKDPNGNPTKGITRRQSYLTINGSDQAKMDGWPQDQYLNIWFIYKFSPDHAGAAAYAYYPFSGAQMPYYDGIIGTYSYMNYDKAIPHEIGHVLNLQHVWGNTNQPGVACGDDQVQDTPPTKGHLTTGCTAASLYDGTCAAGYMVTTPNGIIDYPDTTNAQNVMDYTYCQKMFTIGQSERMRASLTSNVAGRSNLYSPANLAATGALEPRPDLAPVAEFSVQKSGISSDRVYFLIANSMTPFVFRNRSWGDTITNVNWTFSNDASTPTSTSLLSLNNSFKQPGWVTVSLTATGNNSGSTTLTDDHAVYVADTNMLQPGGYTQNFATPADFANWPMFNYYNNAFKWEYYGAGGFDDGACIRFKSYDGRGYPENMTGTPEGDHDDIITPGFDLSGAVGGNMNLNFYTAGGSTAFPEDSIQVQVSIDGGRFWKPITDITGTDLSNNNWQSAEYFPSAGDWQAHTIAIPPAYFTNKVFFKFRYKPSVSGNNLYLDKFSISPFPTEVKEVAATPDQFNIYPNPAHRDTKLAFITGSDGKAGYVITDVAGKVIATKEMSYAPHTVIQENINRSVFGAAGLYLVTVTIANSTSTQKLIIE